MKKSLKLKLGKHRQIYYSDLHKPVLNAEHVRKTLGHTPKCVMLMLCSDRRRGFGVWEVVQRQSRHFPHFVQAYNGSVVPHGLFTVMELTVAFVKRWPAYQHAKGLIFWTVRPCPK